MEARVGDDGASAVLVKKATTPSSSGSGGQTAATSQSAQNNTPKSGKNPIAKQPKKAKPAVVPPPVAETLDQAIKRMFSQGWSRQQIDEQIRKWHPDWSATKIEQDVLRATTHHPVNPERAEVGHGAGQGKPAWQSVPYYKGQKPTIVEPVGTTLYRNPEQAASIGQLATAGLTAADLAFLRRERRMNSDKLGADARWVLHHPAFVAAVAATTALFPEADLAWIEAVGNAATVAAAGKAIATRHYREAALDAAGLKFGRGATRAALQAEREADLATKAGREVRELQEAIISHPGRTTPGALKIDLKAAIVRQNSARRAAIQARHHAAVDYKFAAALAQAAFLDGGAG